MIHGNDYPTTSYTYTVIPGCTCGPYWSVLPPPPCPVHSCTCNVCPTCGKAGFAGIDTWRYRGFTVADGFESTPITWHFSTSSSA